MQKNAAMPQVYTLAQIERQILAWHCSPLSASVRARMQVVLYLQGVPDHLCMPVVLSTDHKDDQDDRQKQLLETVQGEWNNRRFVVTQGFIAGSRSCIWAKTLSCDNGNRDLICTVGNK